MDKIKANLSYVLCTCTGLLFFVLSAFRYFVMFASNKEAYKFDVISERARMTFGSVNGYKLMNMELFEDLEDMMKLDAEFFGKLASVFQILIMVAAVALLLYGALGLLKAFGQFDQFPNQIGNVETKKIANIGLLVFAGMNVLLFLCLIIFTSANTETEDETRQGLCIGAGMILSVLLSGVAAVSVFFLPKWFPKLFETGPEINYVCTQCGKKAKQSEKFCNACGGTIEAVEVKHYEYVCAGCGKKMRKTDKFCNTCGGPMVQREIAPATPAAPVVPEAPAPRVCPNCGKAVGPNNRFCNGCGTAL